MTAHHPSQLCYFWLLDTEEGSSYTLHPSVQTGSQATGFHRQQGCAPSCYSWEFCCFFFRELLDSLIFWNSKEAASGKVAMELIQAELKLSEWWLWMEKGFVYYSLIYASIGNIRASAKQVHTSEISRTGGDNQWSKENCCLYGQILQK